MHRFACYIGIVYQIAGAFMEERANLLASHMRAMGLRDSARVLYAIGPHLNITRRKIDITL